MTTTLRYFIAASTDRDLLDQRSAITGYSTANQAAIVTGSSSVNIVWAAPGVDLDVRNLLAGEDLVFFNRNWADYSKDITSVSGAIIFSCTDSGTGLTERVTVLNGSTTAGKDKLVFANGNVLSVDAKYALTTVGLTVGTSGIVDAEAASKWSTSETSANPGSLIPSTLGGTLRGFGSVASGDTTGAVFGLTQPGTSTILTGSAQVDKAYASAGAIVDARNLLGGEDIIYFTGAWGDYSKSLTAVSGAIVFERLVNNSLTERITVLNGSTTAGRDKLVFTDGAVLSNDAKIALLTNSNIAATSITTATFGTTTGWVAGWGTSETTPLPGPTVTITTTDSDKALKAGETAAVTFTLSAPAGTNSFADSDITVTTASGGLSNIAAGSNNTYTATFTPNAAFEGTATIGVAAGAFNNADGQNNSAASLSFAVDTIAPTLAITSNKPAVKASETATVTLTFSEAPTGFVADDVITTGGTLSAPVVTADSKVYTATFTPTAGFEGNASITVANGAYTDTAGNAGGAGTTPAIAVDTLAPTLAITSNVPAVKISETAAVTLTFSEAPIGFLPGEVTTTGGTLSDPVVTADSKVYTATFTPTAGSSGNASITVASGAYTDTAGNAGGAGTTPAISIDTLAPTITAQAASVGTKTLTLTMSEAVAGTPAVGDFAVVMNTATNAVTAVSASGMTVTLTLTNAIPNNATVTVDYTQGASTLLDGAGNAMVDVGTPLSVTVTNDTTVPTVAGVSSTATDATYNVADVIPVTIQFSEAVTVTGTPQLTLETGTIDRTASYVSGTGTNTLTFNYTVQAGDASTDLGYTSASALALNSGTIQDEAGNSATLTLASPGTLGSLAFGNALVIDGVAPTITAQAATAGTKTVTLTMGEAVTGTPAAGDFAVLMNSAANAVTAVSASGTTVTLTLTNTIPNNATVTVDYTQGTNKLTDTAGNAMVDVGDPVSVTVTNDTTVPTVLSFGSSTGDGAYKADDTINITATMSETVQSGSTFNVTLNTNDTITLTAASAGTTLNGTYTVGAGDNSTDLTVSSFTTGTVTDLAGNAMGSTTLPAGQNLANNKAIVIDTIAPIDGWNNGKLTQNDTGNTTADAGDNLVFAFSEAIGNKTTLEAFFNTSDTYGAPGTRSGVMWSNGDKTLTLTVTLGAGEIYDATTAIQIAGVQDLVGNSSTLNFSFVI